MQKVKYKSLLHVERAFLVLLVMLTTLPSSVSGQETYRFERMWPTLPQPWYFNYPQDIAIGPDGSVYIADSGFCSIQKFTQDGRFITRWGNQGAGDGEFSPAQGTWQVLPSGPNGIAVDNNGNVYVTDTYNHRIQKFNADGIFLHKWGEEGIADGQFKYPFAIAVDQSGYVYVLDYENPRIQKFTSNGVFFTKWGNQGTGNGQFSNPSAITVDANSYVFVTDVTEEGYRIQRFTSDGAFMLKWDNEFPGGARFTAITGMATDEYGNIYLTDPGSTGEHINPRVHKINPEGRLIITWESEYGLNEDELANPSGIALDESGYIYLADAGGSKIKKLNLNFEIINVWCDYIIGDDLFVGQNGISVTSNGTVYLTDAFLDIIHIFTPEGIHTTWGEEGSGPGQFQSPHGIAVDDIGNIYVCDYGNGRIQKFTPGRQYITSWGGGDDLYFMPEGIALDSSGNVYVTDQAYAVNPVSSFITRHHRVQKFTPTLDGTEYAPSIMWETWGNGDTFSEPSGIAIGRDPTGAEYVYVADTLNNYIRKFTLDGQHLTNWTEATPGDAFNWPRGVTTDETGNVYVSDSNNCRVLKFSFEGALITSLGSCGSAPGQLSGLHYLSVDHNEKVYVAEKLNKRYQVFTKAELLENSRAIIVAGGGSYPGNSLWDATQMCANYAYRALTYQGFTKEDIMYLSEDTDLDLDGNRISDDGIVVPSNVSLRDAIRDAAENNAENLVLYLTDHGGADENGDGTFNLGGSEILTASGLASMLDSFPGRIIVIIDACQSGSFMTALEGANRIIITSTQPDERAKFINQGTISFSNFFWTGIFNGSSLWNSYHTASLAVNVLGGQTPDIRPPNVSTDIHIGNGVSGMVGEAPDIGGITITPPELHLETSAVLRANTLPDPDGIARVWAVIWPPNYDPGSVANPLTDLPSVDLLPVAGGEGEYEVAYNGFIAEGIYNIAFYAMDRKDITSQPKFMTLSRNLARRAVIVAGGAGGELSRAMINQNASLAYNALISQRYNAHEINLMSPLIMTPTVFYLGAYLEYLASDPDRDNLDLTIYLIGAGDAGTFAVNDDGELLTASQLDEWLDDLQNKKQSRVTLIYDGNKSGSFIQALIPPEGKERIIITSTGVESAAYFKTDGSISFSSFFWDRIAAGATIGGKNEEDGAYFYAKSAITYCTRENEISFSCYRPQHPLIDANGNGIANERDDYEIAQELHLGDGVAYADDPPLIGSVSVVRDGSSLTITAHNISSVNPVEKVWAVIRPISYCPGDSEGVPLEVLEQELFDPDEDGTYAYTLNVDYACKVTVYAMSRAAEAEEPDISEPSKPIINQPGGDIYEDPDGDGNFDDDPLEANVIVVNHPSPQPHTFHHPDDVDWVKFYGVAWENEVNEQVHTYTIEAGNLGVNCPVIELYKEGNLEEPVAVASNYPVDNKVWFDFDCTRNGLYQEGIYYVKVFRGDCAYTENEMSYDLKVYDAHQELTATVAGRVEDSVSGQGIDGAIIISTGGGADISTRGEYKLSEWPGDWTMTASKDRYIDSSYSINIETSDQHLRQDIDMNPRDTGACRSAADCNDGRYCNGTETCVNRTCQPGTPPCGDDGIFCNGEESCNEATDVCQNSGNPCPVNLTCDEERNACTGCLEDNECNDGQFCNGVETCADGTCRDGTSPCPEGVECDDETDACLMPSIAVFPRTIMQSRWMPFPFFLSIRGTNTHFSGASKATFTPPSVKPLTFVINQKILFCMGLMMPGWITGQLPESLEINVTTGKEVVAGALDLRSLPFMMGEESR